MCALLIEKLAVPVKAPAAAKSVADSTVVNTTRGIYTCTLLMQVWRRFQRTRREDGSRAELGTCTGGARDEVLRYARAKLGGSPPEDDDSLVAFLCDASSFFYGTWLFYDVLLPITTEPFSAWAHGDLEPYLRLFPAMCALVGTVKKPKVQRAMIMKQYVLDYYAREHPDVIQTMCEHAPRLVETVNEYHNARLRRYVDVNVPLLEHGHYLEASCVCLQADALRHAVVDITSTAKDGPTERIRALTKADKPAFADTKSKVCDFITRPLKEMIDQIAKDGKCSGNFADEQWPREKIVSLAEGQAKLEETCLPSLQAHLESVGQERKVAMPEDLRTFLKSSFMTTDHLKDECRRRGINHSKKKRSDLADAVADHAAENPGGFTNENIRDKDAVLGIGKHNPAEPRHFAAARAAAAAESENATESPMES